VAAVGRSDGAGKFSAADLASGSHVLTANAPGYTAPASLRIVQPGSPARTRVEMTAGGVVLAGAVLDASGGVIPGAFIELSSSAGLSVAAPAPPPHTVLRTLTDQAGRFAIGAPRGSYYLRVAAGGYASKGANVVLLGDESQQIALAPAAEISGVVHDERGVPVAGATVTATSERRDTATATTP
jgi:hypothetical protein